MPNLYKNKVVYGGTVLIDITDTTAEASDVAAGKYFYDKSGAKVEGTAASGGGISIVETPDSHGGTIVEITGEEVKLQSKTVTPSSSQQVVSPDTGYTGLSQVTVNAVPAVSLQEKTATPSESSQEITPDSSYNGLSKVTVGAISNTYVGTGVTRQAAKTVTPSETQQTAVAADTYTTGAVTVAAIPSTYVGSGVTKQAAKTVSPSETQQTAVAADTYTTGAVTVGAISSTYVGSGVTKQAAATITPTKSSQQAVAANVYTTGAVTVAAIPAAYQDVTGVTAAAGDVVSGKDIVSSSGTVVHGSLVIQHYYTGSSAPAASLGVNGDIYLEVAE